MDEDFWLVGDRTQLPEPKNKFWLGEESKTTNVSIDKLREWHRLLLEAYDLLTAGRPSSDVQEPLASVIEQMRDEVWNRS